MAAVPPTDPAVLDHLVLAVPDLDAAVEELARRTGVAAVPGGSHPGRGTRNALLGLRWAGGDRHYLELLAPDPAQPDVPAQDLMLGVGASLAARPRMHGWAVRVGEGPHDAGALDRTVERARAAGIDMGEPVEASRRTPGGLRLSWQLAVPAPLGLGGVQPFLIDWGDGPHPTDDPLPSLELVSITLRHPAPEHAAAVLHTLGVDLPVSPGEEPRILATLATPEGEIVLG